MSHTPCIVLSWAFPGGSVQVTSASPFTTPCPLMFRPLHSFISFTSMWSAHQSQLRLFCSRVPGRPVPSPCLLHPVSSPADFPGSVLLGSSTSNHFTLSSRAPDHLFLPPSLHHPSLPFSLFSVLTLSIFPSLLPLILSIYSSLSQSPSVLPSSWPRGSTPHWPPSHHSILLLTSPFPSLNPHTVPTPAPSPCPFPPSSFLPHSTVLPLLCLSTSFLGSEVRTALSPPFFSPLLWLSVR